MTSPSFIFAIDRTMLWLHFQLQWFVGLIGGRKLRFGASCGDGRGGFCSHTNARGPDKDDSRCTERESTLSGVLPRGV